MSESRLHRRLREAGYGDDEIEQRVDYFIDAYAREPQQSMIERMYTEARARLHFSITKSYQHHLTMFRMRCAWADLAMYNAQTHADKLTVGEFLTEAPAWHTPRRVYLAGDFFDVPTHHPV